MVMFLKLTDEEEDDLVELEHLVPDEISNSGLPYSNMSLLEFLNIPLACFMFLLFR